MTLAPFPFRPRLNSTFPVNEKSVALSAPWTDGIERVATDVIHVNSCSTCIRLGLDGKVLSRDARGRVFADLLARPLP